MAAHPAGKFVLLGVGPAGLLILELCKADDGTLALELVQLSGAVLCHIPAGRYSCTLLSRPGGLPQPCLRMELYVNIAATSRVCPAADTQQEALQKLTDVNGLTFSNNGKFLAAGGDGGWLTVLSWPALEVLQEFR